MGGTAPEVLAQGYRHCAVLTRRYGTTYFWGAQLLPRAQRQHVFAVYALCRLADDIVDAPGATQPEQVAATATSLQQFQQQFRETVAAAPAHNPTLDPTLTAVAHTVRTCGIPLECFDRFFGAMTADLTTTSYATWTDLLGYMEGSAAVIGEMMLPVLHPTSPKATPGARALGVAFQLTNFLRDVGEDLDRGRVYLPQQDLATYGADPWLRQVTPQWRQAMAALIERNRGLYAEANRGIGYLPPASARCVTTARVLYSGILERIEAADYDVFTRRARVPTWRKAVVAGRTMTRRFPSGYGEDL